MAIPHEIELAWKMVRSSISNSLGSFTFDLWFKDLELVSFENNTILLGAKSELRFKIVNEKYINVLREHFKTVLGFELPVEVDFIGNTVISDEIRSASTSNVSISNSGISNENIPSFAQDGEDIFDDGNETDSEDLSFSEEKEHAPKGSETNEGSDKDAKTLSDEDTKFNDRTLPPFKFEYTFDNFIVGGSNKFAHAACLAVADHPATNYNPLFIYGPSGLGKTHLLYAINNRLKKNNPDVKIIYIRGDNFTNHMIECLTNSSMAEFRNRYRNCDVLLIDDIQFIAGKVATQEEFFHTFNTLYEEGKQIILTSDRPPKDIETLEDRLKTRFEWGLIADILPPDLELRIAIIKKKAEQTDLKIPEDVLVFLAENLRSNIRQIEGAIKKLEAISFLSQKPIDIDVAESCLNELLGGEEPIKSVVNRILECVAKRYGVKKSDIEGPKRSREIANARHVALYLIRNITEMSLPNIGKIVSRDHTTVISSIDAVTKRRRTDPAFDKELDSIRNEITGK